MFLPAVLPLPTEKLPTEQDILLSPKAKEFFADKLDQPESCRFNCIALYAGRYTEANKAENEQFGDYTNVKLFSKFAQHLLKVHMLKIVH